MKMAGVTSLVVMFVAALAASGTGTKLSEIFEVGLHALHEQILYVPL